MPLNIIPIFNGTVVDSKLTLLDAEFARYKRFLYGRNGNIQLYFKRPSKRKRSLPQNAWFHSVILPMIAEEMGEEDLGKVKAILKSKFLSKEEPIAGANNQWETVKITGRTSKLNTTQFGEFCEKCRRWSSEFLGLDIPDPKEPMPELLIEED